MASVVADQNGSAKPASPVPFRVASSTTDGSRYPRVILEEPVGPLFNVIHARRAPFQSLSTLKGVLHTSPVWLSRCAVPPNSARSVNRQSADRFWSQLAPVLLVQPLFVGAAASAGDSTRPYPAISPRNTAQVMPSRCLLFVRSLIHPSSYDDGGGDTPVAHSPSTHISPSLLVFLKFPLDLSLSFLKMISSGRGRKSGTTFTSPRDSSVYSMFALIDPFAFGATVGPVGK